MADPHSNSTASAVSALNRLREWSQFLKLRLAREMSGHNFDWIFSNLAEYESRLRLHTGRDLTQSRVLEIGYGARPLRLTALISMNVDAWGIDLDQPVLEGKLTEFVQIFRRNGWERALKSLVRHTLFDRRERHSLSNALGDRGFTYRLEKDRFIVGDAARVEHAALGSNMLDLVISEDVFEHLPPATLEQVVARMARWLKPDGIAMVRPLIFTGITGGHLVEWYPETLGTTEPRKSEPWEHLRRQRYVANTFLNKLRLSDYRSVFGAQFEVLEETPIDYGLGRQFLTSEVRAELMHYEEEELLSNTVLFTLRRKC